MSFHKDWEQPEAKRIQHLRSILQPDEKGSYRRIPNPDFLCKRLMGRISWTEELTADESSVHQLIMNQRKPEARELIGLFIEQQRYLRTLSLTKQERDKYLLKDKEFNKLVEYQGKLDAVAKAPGGMGLSPTGRDVWYHEDVIKVYDQQVKSTVKTTSFLQKAITFFRSEDKTPTEKTPLLGEEKGKRREDSSGDASRPTSTGKH